MSVRRRIVLALIGAVLFAAGFAGAAGGSRLTRVCSTTIRTVTSTLTKTTTVVSTILSTVTTTVTGPTTTVTTTTDGMVAYRADYETGDFSQWWHTQFGGAPIGCGGPCTIDNVGNTSAQVVASPVEQGQYAARFDVHSSGGGASSNNRAEVVLDQTQTGGVAGQEWYYGWWTMFPGPSQVWWPNGDGWNLTFQFFDQTHLAAWIGGGIAANNGTPKIFVDSPVGHVIVANPLVYDHWYHFVARFRWATDSTGIEQFWLDGNQVIPATNIQTMPPGTSSITYSQGFYSARNTDNTVYQDGFCRATTYTTAAGC